MARPRLEVADVFRAHGAAWREANPGHVSLGQLKGHVGDRDLSNRRARRRTPRALRGLRAHARRLQFLPQPPLPEVPGRGGAAMARRARGGTLCRSPTITSSLLCPGGDRRDRVLRSRTKGAVYDLLFRSAADIAAHDRRRPEASGRAHRLDRRPLHTWGSALTHHPHVHVIVSRWRRGRRMGRAGPPACPASSCRVRVLLSRLFRRLFLERFAALNEAGRLAFFGDLTPLADAKRAFGAALAPLRRSEWVVYAKATLRRAESRARLSLSPHPPRRDLQFRLIGLDQAGGDFQMEGLPNQRPRPAQDHDARRRRVHSPLSPPRPLPNGFHLHPPLRPLRRNGFRARNIERVRQLLAAPEASPERSRNAADSEAERPSPLRQCPCCGGRMIIVETFEGARSSRAPSPSRIRIDTSSDRRCPHTVRRPSPGAGLTPGPRRLAIEHARRLRSHR